MKPHNPYVGPRAFQDGETLYGRDREVKKLLNLLIAERIVLLYSPSGAGKTSLVQAALIPELREEGFRVLPVIRVGMEPPPDLDLPATTNRYILSTLLSLEEGLPPEQQTPLEELAGMDLSAYLDQRPAEAGETDGDVLIFDQFEEILTVDPTDQAAKAAFFAQLGKALYPRDRWAMFAMREEFLAGLDPYLRPVPTRLSTTFRLELLGKKAARQAIQKPAYEADVPFTDTAAVKLTDDLRRVQVQQPDGTTMEQLGLHIEPVQLQVVCYRLWENLRDEATEIRETDIREAGDVDSALAGYYADQVKAIARTTGVRERAIREWFDSQLITEQGIRGQVLRGLEKSQGLENTAIAPLVDAYLVRAENRRGATWYELAHDRLIEPLRKNNTKWFQEHLSTLQRQAALWENQNRPNGLLLGDEALEDAERWAADHQEELLPVEGDFLAACREARAIAERERRQNRRIRRLAMGATVVSLIAIFAFFIAYYQRMEAERLRLASLVQSLVAQASYQQALDQDERGALLTRQAYLFNQRNRGNMFIQIHSALRSVLDTPYFCRLLNLEETILSAAFRPNGKLLALGFDDGIVQIWDLTEVASKPVVLQGHQGAVWSVAFSPDEHTLASGSSDRTIRLWDLRDSPPTPVVLRGHQHFVFSVAFSPDEKMLASGSLDGTVRLWEYTTSDSVPVILPGHLGGVNSIAFSPDGRALASGGKDKTVRLWDLQTHATPVILHEHQGSVNAVAFSPDGDFLLSGSSDKSVRLWDMNALNVSSRILYSHAEKVLSVQFSPDGEQVISAGIDKTLRMKSWRDVQSEPVVLHGHNAFIFSLAISPDGQTLASGSDDKTVRLWELGQANSFVRLQDNKHRGVKAITLYQEQRELLSVHDDGSVLRWNLDSPELPDTILPPQSGMVMAVFSPDGKTLATSSYKKTLHLWNLETPAIEPMVVLPLTGNVTALGFSPDGRTLASGGDNFSLQLWDVEHPAAEPIVLPIPGQLISSLVFTPEGNALIGGEGVKSISQERNRVWYWNLRNPSVAPESSSYYAHKNHAAPVLSLAVSPDGRSLASGSEDKTIRLWNLHNADLDSIVLQGHKDAVSAILFSPDGQMLVSGSSDHTIRVWQLANPHVNPFVLEAHESPITALMLSQDGNMLVSGSQDGTIILWKFPASLADEVCKKVGRNLTPAEWKQFVGEGIPYESTCPDLH